MLKTIIIIGFVALIMAGFAYLARTSSAMQDPDGGWRIRISRIMSTSMVGLSGLLLIACAAGTYFTLHDRDFSTAGLFIVLTTFALAALMMFVFSLSPDFDVVWNDNSITGISKGITLNPKAHRIKIHWNEIASTGSPAPSLFYVQAVSGETIWWSTNYAGYTELNAVVAERTAHLG